MTPRIGLMALAVAGLLSAAPGVGRAAETPVGLEARGVDPLVALRNAGGLDVRDELGRPVSARLIERQLKAARASASAEAAFSSRLPQARAMALALEFWEGFKAALGLPLSRLPWGELWALPGPKPVSRAVAALVVLSAAFALSYRSSRCRLAFLPRAATGAPEVLRC